MNGMLAYALEFNPQWSFDYFLGTIALADKAHKNKVYRAANKIEISIRRKENYASNPEPKVKRSAAWYVANKEHVSKRLAKKYKESPEFRDDALLRAGTRQILQRAKYREYQNKHRRKSLNYPEPTRPSPQICECCGGPSGKHTFHLDHCHVTNIFRGWLCGNCNRGIGALGDNEEGLLRALAYLKRSKQ